MPGPGPGRPEGLAGGDPPADLVPDGLAGPLDGRFGDVQGGQLPEHHVGGLAEAVDGAGQADQLLRPGRQACRDSPRAWSQGTVPAPQDRQW